MKTPEIKKLSIFPLSSKPYRAYRQSNGTSRITLAPLAKLNGGELFYQYRDAETGAIILSEVELI